MLDESGTYAREIKKNKIKNKKIKIKNKKKIK
jgi:hypothetical protein